MQKWMAAASLLAALVIGSVANAGTRPDASGPRRPEARPPAEYRTGGCAWSACSIMAPDGRWMLLHAPKERPQRRWSA